MGRDDAYLPYRHLFDAAADSLAARLTHRAGKRLYIAEQVSGGGMAEQMEHLACFMAGTFVLGAQGDRAERYMAYAEQLADTCYEARSPIQLPSQRFERPNLCSLCRCIRSRRLGWRLTQ